MSGRRQRFAAVLALSTLACTSDPRAAIAAGDPSWRHDAVWDDGKAELCAYQVEWARYGRLYPGRALLVLVKEPWAPELDVKADTPRPDGFEVLKLNHVRDVPTGIYTYHQMASLYFRRGDASLVKVATTSSEACGVSTALMRDGRLAVHSYFDGVGDRELPWPATALPEDGLPALLRDYVTGDLPERLLVVPTLLDSRLAELSPWEGHVERRSIAAVEVPAGTFAGIELILRADGSARSWVFDRTPPHRLLSYQGPGGTIYRLAKCERLAYWKMHDPGGEAWLPW